VPCEYSLGIDEEFPSPWFFPAHHLVKKCSCLVSELSAALLDTAQRRMTQFAEHFVIVDPDHSDVIWNAETGNSACFDHLARSLVIGSHQSQRFGKRFQPPT
jgi:hypothetical protein